MVQDLNGIKIICLPCSAVHPHVEALGGRDGGTPGWRPIRGRRPAVVDRAQLVLAVDAL